ncbi:MAG: hypothetical protein J2P28_04620 [Actinobacteria bacterium]|nr:hypothetical protein [Actinomycetota bacterium]MBO0834790.1 hypothetical protein [Actinomycetota bacterium]
MNQAPLLKAIATALMVLEDSGDEWIDRDIAVRGMENIAHDLLALSQEDRTEFIELLKRIADEETHVGSANFIRNIPRMIGMIQP